MIALALPHHVRSWMRSRAHHALAFLRGYLRKAERAQMESSPNNHRRREIAAQPGRRVRGAIR